MVENMENYEETEYEDPGTGLDEKDAAWRERMHKGPRQGIRRRPRVPAFLGNKWFKITVDGEEVGMKMTELMAETDAEIVAGTNGMRGGDWGHGSRTVVRLYFGDSFCGNLVTDSLDGEVKGRRRASMRTRTQEQVDTIEEKGIDLLNRTVTIVAGGDAETALLADMFSRIGNILKTQIWERSYEDD